MKKYILTLLYVCCFSVVMYGQEKTNKKDSSITDTVAYIKKLVEEKARFTNAPFGKMVKTLKLPIKSYWISPSPNDTAHVCVFSLFFEDQLSVNRKMAARKTLSYINVIFDPGLPQNKVAELMQKNKGRMDEEMIKYLALKNIKDIK